MACNSLNSRQKYADGCMGTAANTGATASPGVVGSSGADKSELALNWYMSDILSHRLGGPSGPGVGSGRGRGALKLAAPPRHVLATPPPVGGTIRHDQGLRCTLTSWHLRLNCCHGCSAYAFTSLFAVSEGFRDLLLPPPLPLCIGGRAPANDPHSRRWTPTSCRWWETKGWQAARGSSARVYHRHNDTHGGPHP